MISVAYDLSAVKWNPIPYAPSIAANPSDSAKSVYLDDGVRFYVSGSKDYAGALWNTSLPLLPIPDPFTATLSGQLMLDDAVATNAQAVELDMMAVNASGDVGNGSGQFNLNVGGVWQAISSGAWTSIPNFMPIMPTPNQWTQFMAEHSFNPQTEQSQFVGCAVGTSNIGGGLSPQPYAKLGWAPGQMVVQVQLTLAKGGGCCSFKLGKPTLTVVYS